MPGKQVTINGVEAFEQTLEEFVATLPQGHTARLELGGLHTQVLDLKNTIAEQQKVIRKLQKAAAKPV